MEVALALLVRWSWEGGRGWCWSTFAAMSFVESRCWDGIV